jgi:hypothetical protein
MSTVIAVIVCFALFVGGLLLFGIAPTLTDWQAAVFFAGILCVAASLAIPVHLLPKLE